MDHKIFHHWLVCLVRCSQLTSVRSTLSQMSTLNVGVDRGGVPWHSCFPKWNTTFLLVTCYDMWYWMSLVTVEIHLETGLQFGPSWIRGIWRSFLVRLISNVGTDNFRTPQHSRNHSKSFIQPSQKLSRKSLGSRKITSWLLKLSKGNWFYISDQGPSQKALRYFTQLTFNYHFVVLFH